MRKMAKHDYVTEYCINALCKYREWVQNQDAPPLAKKIVIDAINLEIDDCLKAPQPPEASITESIEELEELRSSMARLDWPDIIKYLLMTMIEQVEKDLK